MNARRLRARNQKGWLAETGNGEYQANWNEYVTNPETGKVKRRHRTKIIGEIRKMRKCDAEKELAKLIVPMNDSTTALQDGRMTLSRFLDEKYIPAMKGGWRDGTYSSILCDLAYMRATLGDKPLDLIDLPAAQSLLDHLARGRKLSESTVSRVKMRMKAIMEYAAELDFIRRNPLNSRYYKMPICKPCHKPVLRKEQISALWSAVTDVRDRLILVLAGACGIRESEVFGLEWECVHPDHVEIRSRAYRGQFERHRVKKQASHRNVPIPPAIYQQFQNWRALCKSDALLVFASKRTGQAMWPQSWLDKRIKPIAAKIGIPKTLANFRVLRRSFATWNSKRLKDSQTVLGHSSIELTGNVYAQGVEENAATLVNDYYGEIATAATRQRIAQSAMPTRLQ